jgi:hypothetical protein
MQAIKVQTITWLRGDPILTGLVAGRVYTVVPPTVIYPLITVEGAAPRTANTFRNPKRSVSVQVRAQSQQYDESELDTIADRILQVLEGADATPCGPCRSARWTVDPTQNPAAYTDAQANVVTRHRPVILRIELTP